MTTDGLRLAPHVHALDWFCGRCNFGPNDESNQCLRLVAGRRGELDAHGPTPLGPIA
jgi:hypothetical protein